MCSLSSTLRYCCVGPAPFDDIGDIPYHDSRVIQPPNSHTSPDAPHLPRLPSTPNTIRRQDVPGVPSAPATPPDKCCSAASEVKEGTECREFDGRCVEGTCPPVTQCLHGKSLVVSDYGSRCVVDGCGNHHQHKCSANHSHIVQSLDNNPFTPSDCPCQHHQNEAQLQDSGHRSHNLNNLNADNRLKNYLKDCTFNRRYGGDDCHDDINMNNYVHPGSSPSLEDTINLDQQRSHYLGSAASSSSHDDSLEETDSSCETLIIWSEQMNRNTRRHNARQRSPPLGTVTLLAEWSRNTMSFSHSAASPSSTPPVGFPRYAWEESKQTIQTTTVPEEFPRYAWEESEQIIRQTTAVPVEFPRYAWEESEQIIQTTAAAISAGVVDKHGWRFCFVQPISLIPEHVINDQ